MSKKIYLTKNIGFLRNKSGLSRTALAIYLKTSPDNIAEIEAGFAEMNIDHLVKAATLFGVSTDALLCYDMADEYAKQVPDIPSSYDHVEMPLFSFELGESKAHLEDRFSIFVNCAYLDTKSLDEINKSIIRLWCSEDDIDLFN